MESRSDHPRVVGRYALYDPIAKGGMATVHLGRLLGPIGFSRTVAIKRMRPELAADPEFVSMFLDEARLVARISHPNVVPTLDVVHDEGELLIVMEYVRGESLWSLLRSMKLAQRPVSPALAVALVSGVLHGLHAAHEARSETGKLLGIVHRDVNPQNILVGVDGVPRVLDFGVAMAADRLARSTREGELKGKLSYMAPEQLTGSVSRASDVYAASVVLWEALAGERLFASEDEGQTIAKILVGCTSPPSAHAAGVPPTLDALTLRGLSQDPAQRFATAHEMANSLEECGVETLRATQIGEWVQSLARDTLDRRSDLVAALESSSSLSDSADTATRLDVRAPSPGRRRRRRAALWALAVVVVGVTLGALGAGLFVRRRAQRAEPVVALSATAAVDAPIRAITLADQPLPSSRVPAAATEYAAGMQALHDNSWDLAARHFERAVELDPALAEGHMRLSMVEETDPTRKRDEFAKAAALRSKLSHRDQTLLEALEPVLRRAQVDRTETIARLERASLEFPGDVEFLDWIGTLHENDPLAALPRAEQAILLDPTDGDAWQTKAHSLGLLGRTDEARVAFQRCADLSVNSVDCLLDITEIDAAKGRCDEYEIDARKLADRSPHDYRVLAKAMYAKGRPLAAVNEVLEHGLSSEEEPDRTIDRLVDRRAFALLAGDLSLAEDSARRALASLRASPKRDDLTLELSLSGDLLELLEETGRDDEAQRFAYDVVTRSDAWTSNNATAGVWDPSFLFMRRAVGRGGLSIEEFERRRSSGIEERLRSLGAYPGLLWAFAYAAPATTPDEARAAVAALPRFMPLTSVVSGAIPDPDADAGHAHLLAGKAADAVAYLKRAVANCSGLLSFVMHMRASLHLGQALEATGDKPGACAAYKVVLDRWGRAKPRSVTADKAKERARALECPK